jgi:hypothetical protein
MNDDVLRQIVLYADAVPQMALVRRGLVPVQVLLQRYLEQHLGTAEEVREVGPYWRTPVQMLRDLAEVWDDMQCPHHPVRPLFRSIRFQLKGVYRGRDNSRLHVLYRVPPLVLRRWRRHHLTVLALIF